MRVLKSIPKVIHKCKNIIRKVHTAIEDTVLVIKKYVFQNPLLVGDEEKERKQVSDSKSLISESTDVPEKSFEITVEVSKPIKKVNPYEMEYTRVRKLTDNYVVLDFETTGFSETRDRIIQIGAVKYQNHNLIDQYTTYINPQREISPRITKITGITNEMVKNAPLIEQSLPELVDFISDFDLVAHNASFDMKFLLFNMIQVGLPYKRFRVIDTLSLARKHINTDNHKLVTLKKHFGLDQYTSHDALGDCFVTGEVYKYCYEREINPPLMTFKEPEHYEGYDLFTIGETLYTNKQYDEAEKYLLASVKKGNDAPEVFRRLAILYRKQKRYQDELNILILGKSEVQKTQGDYRDVEFESRIRRVKELIG